MCVDSITKHAYYLNIALSVSVPESVLTLTSVHHVFGMIVIVFPILARPSTIKPKRRWPSRNCTDRFSQRSSQREPIVN